MYNICKKYVPYINTIRYNIKHDIYKKKQKNNITKTVTEITRLWASF